MVFEYGCECVCRLKMFSRVVYILFEVMVIACVGVSSLVSRNGLSMLVVNVILMLLVVLVRDGGSAFVLLIRMLTRSLLYKCCMVAGEEML